jgi:hypothetical protein
MTIVVGSLVALATAAIVALIVGAVSYLQLLKSKKRGPTLQDRLSNLTNSLESATTVISEIEFEVSKRKDLAQKLETDIKRYQNLQELNKDQIEAVAQTLSIPLKTESRKSLIYNTVVSFIIALVFFAIGYFIGTR